MPTTSSLPRNIKLDREITSSVALPDGRHYLATSGNQIWKVDSGNGAMKVYAGTPNFGNLDGLSMNASFSEPNGLALMRDGCVVVCDTGNNSIRLISPCGRFVGTLTGQSSGSGDAYVDGQATNAKICSPWGVCVGIDESIYFTDTGNNCVRKVKDGVVSTIAGAPYHLEDDDGNEIDLHVDANGPNARFSNLLRGITCDDVGNIYVCDYRTIRKIDVLGNVSTIVGDPKSPKYVDGTFTDARMSLVKGITIDGESNLLVSDGLDPSRIRLVNFASKSVSTITGHELSVLDRTHPETTYLTTVRSISLDSNGDILIPDASRDRLRVFPHSKGLLPFMSAPYEPSVINRLDADLRHLCVNASSMKADVAFVVADTTTIHAHSCILMNRCELLLRSPLKDISGRLIIRDISPVSFQALLIFLYTRNTDIVDDTVVFELLRLADTYRLHDLHRYCVYYIESNLSDVNAVRWFLSCHTINQISLREMCKKYLVAHYRDIHEQHPDTISELVRHAQELKEISVARSIH